MASGVFKMFIQIHMPSCDCHCSAHCKGQPSYPKYTRRLRLAAVLLYGGAALSVGLVLYWPEISGWEARWKGIRAIDNFDLSQNITEQSTFASSTYTNRCSWDTVIAFYEKATERLATHSQELRTYRGSYFKGTQRVTTVLQTTGGYIAVGASWSDEGVGSYVRFSPGCFCKPKDDVLSTTDMPKRIRHELIEWNR